MTAFSLASVPLAEAGDASSRTALVLHGGGGPRTVAPIVGHLAPTMHVLAPTHPGWEGTPLPESLESIAQLAAAYLELLARRNERDVVVVGSSLGGWIALEMGVQARRDDRYAGLLGAVIDIDGVGVEVSGETVADFFALDPRGLAEAAWHDPDRGYIDPASLTDDQRAVTRGNGRAMKALAGSTMSDPTLLSRLDALDVPTLVIWGSSDRIVTPAYGQAIAAAIPGAVFVEVPEAGHLPHLEAPDATWAEIDPFLDQS